MLQVILLLVMALAVSAFGAEWTLQNMLQVKMITETSLSPDHKTFLTVVKNPSNDLKPSIFLGGLEVAENGSSPTWSPDGTQFAYIANDQIEIYDIASKGSKTLTHSSEPISYVKWSPNGLELAFITQKPLDKSVITSLDEEAKANSKLWLISSDGKSPKQLTDGSFHIGTGVFAVDFAFSPDGKTIICPKMPTANINQWLKTELVKIDLATNTVTPFLPPLSFNPHFSPDGKWVAYVKTDLDWYFVGDVWIAPIDGGASQPLTHTFDRQMARGAILGWSEDSQNVYVMDYRRTKAEFSILPISGKTATEIPLDIPKVLNPTLSGHLISFIGESTNRPPEVFIYDLKKQKMEQASHFNEFSLEAIAKTDLIQFKAKDGLEIEALLTYPQNYDKSKPFPLLIISHGGPIGPFQEDFIGAPSFYPIATFASRGFGVMQCNIRGSTGYGIDFRKANDSDWGGGDFQDMMAGIAYLKDKNMIDNSKMGIMGWSYGGYMTAWAITQTDQFKAASVGAGITNLVSFTGTSDLPSYIPGSFGGELWEKWDLLLERSPMTHVQNIHTPTLIQHGREDMRVPMSQGIELYQALKRLGVPTKIMLLPRTEHNITETKIVRELAEANLDWFGKYIQ